MKTIFLLTISLLLAGCQYHASNAVAPSAVEKFHWALVDKQKIDTAIFTWSRAKMEEVKKTESLAPDMEEKIRHYESLNNRLLQKHIEIITRRPMMPPPRFPREGASTPELEKPVKTQAEQEYDALSEQVAEAKAPVADIVDRRDQQVAQLREEYKTEKLIAEYAKGRFDLVVEGGYHSPVVYQTSGDVVDITGSILNLFKEKTKS